jgi:hypothetical protein
MCRGNVISNGSIFNLIERNITPPSDEFVLAVRGPKYFQTSTSHWKIDLYLLYGKHKIKGINVNQVEDVIKDLKIGIFQQSVSGDEGRTIVYNAKSPLGINERITSRT